MKKVKVSKMNVGDEYYFVDTRFIYSGVPLPTINKEKVHRIVGNQFSTKNDNWIYEVERFEAFSTEDDAKKYAIKKLNEYKQYWMGEFKKSIKLLQTQLQDK